MHNKKYEWYIIIIFILGIKICDEPVIYLVDSPGVMIPSVIDGELGLKLGLVGNIRENLVGKEIIIEYMLWFLNKYNNQIYWNLYGNAFYKNSKEWKIGLVI